MEGDEPLAQLEDDEFFEAIMQDAESLDAALSKLPESAKPELCDIVAMELLHRFEQTGSIDCLNQVIITNERAVQYTPDGDLHFQAGRLSNLGITLRKRFDRTQSIDDINRAITVQERAVSRFHRMTLMDDIDRAIITMEKVVASTSHSHCHRVFFLKTLGSALQSRFERKGLTDDLERMITVNEQAIASAGDNHPDYALMLSTLGEALRNGFDRTGLMTDLDRAITMNEQAVASVQRNNPNRSRCLHNLALSLLSRFKRMGSIDDLDRSIMTHEHAIIPLLEEDTNRAAMLNDLGVALRSRFERTGLIDDLHRAITATEQAIASSTENHPSRAAMYSNLGDQLRRRFDQLGSLDDLGQAITMNEQALSFIAEDHRDRSTIFNNLGTVLLRQFERTGIIDDLNRAVAMNERAVSSARDDQIDPSRSTHLNNLGIALRMRFERTGSTTDLDRAIISHEQAVKLTPDGHPDLAGWLSDLGSALRSLFDVTGSLDDLNRAIAIQELAVTVVPDDHTHRSGRLHNLGIALQSRFELTSLLDELDRVIATNEQAIACIPEDHPNRATMLNNLGIALLNRFEWTGIVPDLDRAIRENEQAVNSTPVDHPNYSKWIYHLATLLQARYERTGSLEDLDRAIILNNQAVTATSDDHPNHALMLCNLGTALQARFQRIGSMDDIDLAIKTMEKAAASAPKEHLNHATLLRNAILFNNLGCALQSRFQRTRCLDDLHRAIRINEQAVAFIPDKYPDRCSFLNNLGVALHRLFEETVSIPNLDRAVVVNEEVVASTPDSHPNRAKHVSNLGMILHSKFKLTGLMDHLDRAIMVKELAVESTPDDHPDRAGFLDNLGTVLLERFEAQGSTNDLDRAIIMKEKAVTIQTAPPFIRLKAASTCSDLLISRKLYNRAKPILHAAVRLLPTISLRTLKQTDQQHNISQFSNLTFRAVSLFLADSEDTYSTVQLLEVGRGILANLQLEIRSDVSNLLTSHPILAQQFQDLRDQIDSPFVMNSLLTSEPPNTLISVNQRRKLVKQFDDLLTSIRSLDGFENFLRGPSKSELYRLAEQGPIVVFNISDIRSDAFLITTKEIRSVHLPFLRSDSVKDLARMNLRNLRLRKLNSTDAEAQEGTVETQPDRDDDMNRKARPPFPRSPEDATQITLKWLWDAAVNPVLTELGFLKPPEGVNWPHIWWVPSGLLTRLPLHAAGDYGKGTTFNTLDRVVSSYVPTLKSLLYAREKAITWSNNEDQAALLVAMPTTPHQNALPGARKEVKEIEALIANDISKTVMLQPTKREVLKCLPKCQIAHFACHGESDPNDPSQSRLLLEDWKKDPLSVADITALNLDNVRFAYLSACSAAENQVEDLIDEGIHLTGAFQLAGFPSVVGTLWHVSDEHSVTVAMEVYREMCKTSKKFNSGKAALALHLAVRNLKSERWENPLLWAPYIHMGV